MPGVVRHTGVLAAVLAAVFALAAGADQASGREADWGHRRAAAAGCGLMLAAGVASLGLDRLLNRVAGPVAAYAASVGVRGFAGAGLGLGVVLVAVPPAARPVYLGWLLAAYLATLVTETVLLVRAGAARTTTVTAGSNEWTQQRPPPARRPS